MTRTNIIRESDEILGDRNQVRLRSSSKSSSSERNDPIFKDFRKERLGHYPELVRHRIQSKQHQHEQLRKRLRDQGMIHNLTQREIRHLDLNQKYVYVLRSQIFLITQNTHTHNNKQIHRRC